MESLNKLSLEGVVYPLASSASAGYRFFQNRVVSVCRPLQQSLLSKLPDSVSAGLRYRFAPLPAPLSVLACCAISLVHPMISSRRGKALDKEQHEMKNMLDSDVKERLEAKKKASFMYVANSSESLQVGFYQDKKRQNEISRKYYLVDKKIQTHTEHLESQRNWGATLKNLPGYGAAFIPLLFIPQLGLLAATSMTGLALYKCHQGIRQLAAKEKMLIDQLQTVREAYANAYNFITKECQYQEKLLINPKEKRVRDDKTWKISDGVKEVFGKLSERWEKTKESLYGATIPARAPESERFNGESREVRLRKHDDFHPADSIYDI